MKNTREQLEQIGRQLIRGSHRIHPESYTFQTPLSPATIAEKLSETIRGHEDVLGVQDIPDHGDYLLGLAGKAKRDVIMYGAMTIALALTIPFTLETVAPFSGAMACFLGLLTLARFLRRRKYEAIAWHLPEPEGLWQMILKQRALKAEEAALEAGREAKEAKRREQDQWLLESHARDCVDTLRAAGLPDTLCNHEWVQRLLSLQIVEDPGGLGVSEDLGGNFLGLPHGARFAAGNGLDDGQCLRGWGRGAFCRTTQAPSETTLQEDRLRDLRTRVLDGETHRGRSILGRTREDEHIQLTLEGLKVCLVEMEVCWSKWTKPLEPSNTDTELKKHF